ncbi:ABC transporter permease subunit [Fredinandcohnia humi]
MTIRHILVQVRSIVFLFILASLPLTITAVNGRVKLNWEGIIKNVQSFIEGLVNGSSLYYLEGERLLFFPKEVLKHFATSYFYGIASSILVLILALIFGILLWKSEKGFQTIIGFIAIIPDFVLIFLLQMLVIFIYDITGMKVARVASPTMEEPAVALPLIVLFILPFVYLVRSLSEKTFDILTEDYIRTAISKGFKRRYIYLYHVTPNILPYLKADLHKVASIMISNLFIVEYLFNINGLTSMLFPMVNEYQYNLIILCFASMFILYLFIFFSLKLVIITLERILK